ncbi:mei2 [Symbiodinium sp. CCMP2592]|nr:mei2 [Symbiodinium sp. CCMP2592]
MERHEQQSAAVEAAVDRRPCAKSLACQLDPSKVADETKRVLRLKYHRVISPPTVYLNYKRAAVDIDLQGKEVRLHTDPVLQEGRFVRQRAREPHLPPAPGGTHCFLPASGLRKHQARLLQ